MKTRLLLLLIALLGIQSYSQTITIPDSNFEQSLIDLGFDTNGLNGNILKNDAEAIDTLKIRNPLTNPLTSNVAGKISDLTGIESMVNLKYLDVRQNELTAVNVSKNLNLEVLLLQENQLTQIDVSNNTKLIYLLVQENKLTQLDVSKNLDLVQISAYNNQISSIDVTQNTNLLYLWLGGNPNDLGGFSETNTISSLDVSKNSALLELIIAGLKLSNLDITSNQSLTLLNANSNQLSTINISQNTNLSVLAIGNNAISNVTVSDKPELTEIHVFKTLISELDLSQNPKLAIVDVADNNNLTSLNLKNGNNANFTQTTILNNPNLSCVSVDDENADRSSWNVSSGLNFKNTCPAIAPIVSIPDSNFEQSLIDLGFDTNGLNGNILKSDAEAITELNIASKNIADLTGVKAMINLKHLDVSQNLLTGIDLSKNSLLEDFVATNNQIINIDIRENLQLKKLFLNDNSLVRVFLKNNNNTAITDFTIINNPDLKCIAVDDVAWSSSNWTNKDTSANYNVDCSAEWEVYTTDSSLYTAITSTPGIDSDNDGVVTYEEAQAFTGDLDLSGKGITDITGLEAFTNAKSINIAGNNITDINSLLNGTTVIISSKKTKAKQTKTRAAFTGLQTLDVSNNKITSVDISKLTSLNTLTTLNLSNNKLTYLNINNGNNSFLTTLNVTGNPDLGCIQVDNVSSANSNSGWIKDTTANFSTACQKPLLLEDQFLSKALQIYPNPVTDKLTIETSNQITIKKIQLYTIMGKLVKEKAKTNQVNISLLPSGIYLLQVETNNGSLIKKIVKK